MRLAVLLASVYVGGFVGLQTLRHWRRLGHSPIARMTNERHAGARALVEDTVGVGLMAWAVFNLLYVVAPGWWRALPHAASFESIRHACALAAYGVSVVLLTAGNLSMGASWRMGITDAPEPLVRDGLYRYVRHPIYGAMLAYFGATALVMPNLLVIPIMTLAMFSIVCEAAMEEDYWLLHEPAAYREMLATTDRFFPWRSVWRKR